MHRTSLNHTFRLVWSDIENAFVAVAENVKGQGKSSRSGPVLGAIALAAAGAMLAGVSGTLRAQTLPSGGQVVAGSASIATSGKTLTVTQATDRMAADWQSFSIGQGNTVNFVQPAATSVALNRVLGSDVSVIQGALNANGQVFLVNPNGVLFSPTAQVNVGGLVASTLNVSTVDFMAGKYTFEGSSSNAIVNQGHITAANGGSIALIAAKITNTGRLTANQGHVLLGAGAKVTLDLGGPVKLQVEQGALDTLIEQGGAIQADGGLVYLTAKAAGSLASSVINHTGITEAQTLATGETGQIYLMGDMAQGRVQVGGTLRAESGFIETSAANVKVQAGTQVRAGHWLIDPTDITVDAGMASTLEGQLGSGHATVTTAGPGSDAGDIFVESSITWSSGNTLTLRADRNIEINAGIDASAGSGGQLALEYGQGAAVASNTATYTINAPVRLQAGANFSTKLGSDGASVNYIVVNSQAALQAIPLNGNYALGSSLSFTGPWVPLGDATTPTTLFTGRFDGLGNTISNLTIDLPAARGVGLFGVTSTTAEIAHLGILDAAISGDGDVGALVGENQGVVRNSYAAGTIGIQANTYAGGLVGFNKGIIESSHSSLAVHASNRVGGLVGVNDWGGTIRDSYSVTNLDTGGDQDLIGGLVGDNLGTVISSYATGNVTTPNSQAGGLAGRNHGSISSSYASGNVISTSLDPNQSRDLGGLVGLNQGSITDSYALGEVSGITNVGGLIGQSDGGSIANTYATGKVTGQSPGTGGLIGLLNAGSLTNSYWDADTTAQAAGVGSGSNSEVFALNSTRSAFNLGEYVGDRHTYGTFDGSNWIGFDFANTWFMLDGATRPFLRSEWSSNITNAHQLQLVAMKPDASYTLANNINLSPSLTNQSAMWKGTGSNSTSDFQGGFAPIGNFTTKFSGSLNGNGYTVSNLTISAGDYASLLGYTLGASISNLTLSNLAVSSTGGWVGGLVGRADNTTLNAIHINGTSTISSTTSSATARVGGMVGLLLGSSTLSSATSNATVTATSGSRVGGLVGESVNSGGAVSITDSSATGDVIAVDRVGGLVGYANVGSQISSSSASGTVAAKAEAGGLVGYALGNTTYRVLFDRVFASGNVTATDSMANGIGYSDTGGLVGTLSNYATVQKSHATGNVTANGRSVGGLVGYMGQTDSRIETSYATGNVVINGNSSVTNAQQGEAGGLVGGVTGGANGWVKNSYASGSVTAPNVDGTGAGVGSLIGRIRTSGSNFTVENSYAVGAVSATGGVSTVGGLIGQKNGATITSSYWATQTTGQTTSDGGTSKTTAEMKDIATFVGWDIENEPGYAGSYPYPRLTMVDGGPVWRIKSAPAPAPDPEPAPAPALTPTPSQEAAVSIVQALAVDVSASGFGASPSVGVIGLAGGSLSGGSGNTPGGGASGGLSFVEISSEADGSGTGGGSGVNLASTGGSGSDPAGFMRVFVVNGGINLPGSAIDRAGQNADDPNNNTRRDPKAQ